MTSRGIEAIRGMPRAIATRRVFHVDGRPISWVYFWREIWTPALKAAGLDHRAPYNLRHSYALHRLQAGVPVANLARQMGHADVSRTFQVYDGWVRAMGADSAAMHENWIAAISQSGRRTDELRRNTDCAIAGGSVGSGLAILGGVAQQSRQHRFEHKRWTREQKERAAAEFAQAAAATLSGDT